MHDQYAKMCYNLSELTQTWQGTTPGPHTFDTKFVVVDSDRPMKGQFQITK